MPRGAMIHEEHRMIYTVPTRRFFPQFIYQHILVHADTDADAAAADVDAAAAAAVPVMCRLNCWTKPKTHLISPSSLRLSLYTARRRLHRHVITPLN